MRKLTTTLALAAALVALPACSTISTMYDVATKPVSMAAVLKSALTVEIAFAGALTAANVYAGQEKCGPTAPPAPLCADPALVAKAAALATDADAQVRLMDATVHQIGVSATVADAAVQAAKAAVEALRLFKGAA